MSYSVKGFFEIIEDMVQILLMLEVLFCSVVALPAVLNPASSSAVISSVWGLSLFKMTFRIILLE